ncbi:uncharacterized protein FYW47_017337 [Aplochiton taeniatus]
MARPQFGHPRFRPRTYSDGHSSAMREEHFAPHFRGQRGFRGHPSKTPLSWREFRGRGRPPFTKRRSLMEERRELPFQQWRSQNNDVFQSQHSQMDPRHGHRRHSPSRPDRPPQAHHRSSVQSPAQGAPSHRGPPFHRNTSGHRSPSPHHYHGQSPDMRPLHIPPHRGTFRGPKRRLSPPYAKERTWAPQEHHNPRERQFDRPARGGKRWNGPFSHQHNGERGSSGSPQMKPREFHGRGSYSERWSAERDPRKQHAEVEREGSRRHSAEWAEGPPHHPPHRPSSWKGGRSSSPFYQNSASERSGGPPSKRRIQDHSMPTPGPGLEHGHPKHPKKEVPQFLNGPRGFGGRPLSLKDKSRILKGRKMRAESVVRIRAPPLRKTIPQEQLTSGDARSILAQRKERFQANADPLRKMDTKRIMPRQSPAKSDCSSSQSSRDSDTVKGKESHLSLSTHSSSPLDKHLTRDLVVVSQWQAGPSTSTSPKRDRSPGTVRYFKRDGQAMLSDRYPPKDQRGRYSNMKMHRPFSEESQRTFRGRGSTQRPNYRPGSPNRVSAPRVIGPEAPFRKPLMGSFVPRPFQPQKPVFRKSQSIMSKYRNMQTLRQREPIHRSSLNQRRW